MLAFAVLAFMVVGCSGKSDPTVPGSDHPYASANGQAPPGLTESLDTGTASGQLVSPDQSMLYYPDEVLVVLHDGISTGTASLDDRPLKLVEKIECRWGTVYQLAITDGTSVEEMVNLLKAEPDVRFAEPNYIYYHDEPPYYPNDPMYAAYEDPAVPNDSAYDQWGPYTIGAPAVWNELKGSEDVVVCVMDTGVRRDHEDLADNVWINEDEDPDNGVDDDLNGYIDDWVGWNAWDNNNDPWDDGAYASYHGTACSGVVAATQDNERGVSGVAPGVRIMGVKVDLTGYGNLAATVVEGLNYAAVNRADIVSMSFGTTEYSDIMKTACEDAWDSGNGVILMASAGNSDSTGLKYPTGYDVVMTIGATCPYTDGLAPRDEKRIVAYEDGYYWGSNYGDHLTVMGFGAQYTTTYGGHYDSYWDGGYNGFFGGTSCACPMSAGVMALIRSYFPTETPEWSWQRLEETADDLETVGFDIQTGHGRVNALRAVYGSDRFSELEDVMGFVPLAMPDDWVFDTIHDVPGNPYYDTEDKYKLTTGDDGFLIIELEILTWGEDLDMALYADPNLTELVDSSTGANHYNSSFESINMTVEPNEDYYIWIYSPQVGGSTGYGLRVHNTTNSLVVTGESITPDFIYGGGDDVPFLKLNLEVGYLATLDEIIINKSGTLPNANMAEIRLYQDTNFSGGWDGNDTLIAQENPPLTNRARFTGLGIEWGWEYPLVLFAVADISEIPGEADVRLSLETYKDVKTEEGLEADYHGFPISSDIVSIGPDTFPPEWVDTIGAVSVTPAYHSLWLGWNEAIDEYSEPVIYNIYHTDTLPFDIGTATKIADVNTDSGTSTVFRYQFSDLPLGVEQYYVVRAEDQLGNEDENLVIVSGFPGESGNPLQPEELTSYETNFSFDIAITDDLLLIADAGYGLQIYDRSDPINLSHLTSWEGDTVYCVTADGDFAYLGGYDYFTALDLSSPETPVATGSIAMYSGYAVDKVDNWVYCAEYYGDTLPVDVLDPYFIHGYEKLNIPGIAFAYDMDIRGNEIYIAFYGAGIVVLDRTDHNEPEYVNTFGSTALLGLTIEEPYLFAVDQAIGTIGVYNIVNNPTNPIMEGESDVGPSDDPYDLVLVDDYAYVACYNYGLVVFDISDPENPFWVSALQTGDGRAIATDGTFIYLMGSSELVVII